MEKLFLRGSILGFICFVYGVSKGSFEGGIKRLISLSLDGLSIEIMSDNFWFF